MKEHYVPEFSGVLRSFMLKVPASIYSCSGIKIFGKTIKSLVFSTDLSIIRNCNADAVIAVYPFTPQPIINQAIVTAADIPVFTGVGGGRTTGDRVIDLARDAECQGAIGVVVNSPTSNETIAKLKRHIDIPIVVSVVSADEDIEARLEAGADIFNVTAAAKTPEIVSLIRSRCPKAAIIATGGPGDETVTATIEAGANAITWTPPTSAEIFKSIMNAYRSGQKHP